MRLIALFLFLTAKANAALLLNCPLQGSVCADLTMEGTVPTLTFGAYQCYGPYTDGPQAFAGSAAFNTAISTSNDYAFQAWINLQPGISDWVIFNPIMVANDFYVLWEGNVIHWNAAGSRISTPANTVYPGSWYKLKITWDGTTRRIFINDVEKASGVSTGLLGVVTSSLFGRYTAAGYAKLGYLRDVSFSDNDAETMPESSAIQVTNKLVLGLHGHSITRSGVCASVSADAFRVDATDRLATYGISAGFTGNQTFGTTYTDGVGGYVAADVDARMTDKLVWSIPNPSTATAVIVMTLTNDALAGTSLSSVRTSLDSIVTKIVAKSGSIPIFFVTDLLRSDSVDIGVYNAVERDVVRIWRGAGKRNIFLIDAEAIVAGNCDGVHPTALTNQRLGQLVADEIVRQYIYPVSRGENLYNFEGQQ